LITLDGDSKNILIKDENNLLVEMEKDGRMRVKIPDTESIHYQASQEPIEELLATYKEDGYAGILHLPPMNLQDKNKFNFRVNYRADKPLGPKAGIKIKQKIKQEIRKQRIEAEKMDQQFLKDLEKIRVDFNEKSEAGNVVSSSLSYVLGFGMGFLMYMIIMIYGTMVMKGIMEEKTSRIVEVMLSSLRPFQLMIGKIIGIGAVGLTQLSIIGIFVLALNMIFGLLASGYIELPVGEAETMAQDIDMDMVQGQVQAAFETISNINIPLLIFAFLFYFLGGYLIYAALFAAVGSAIDDDSESQILVLPITIPIIISFFIMIVVVDQPDSSLAFWSSMFPLSSPLIMPARMPFGVPAWQLILSMALLVGGFIFTTWVAAKIYRTGILMYGKKISIKELGKWLFYKN